MPVAEKTKDSKAMPKGTDVVLIFKLHIDKQRFEFTYKPGGDPSSDLADMLKYDPDEHEIQIKEWSISPGYDIKTISFLTNYFNEKGMSSDSIAKKILLNAVENHLKTALAPMEEAIPVKEAKEDDGEESKEDTKEDTKEAEEPKEDRKPDKSAVEKKTKDIRVAKVTGDSFAFIVDVKNLTITYKKVMKADEMRRGAKINIVMEPKHIVRTVDYIESKKIKLWVNGHELKPADEIDFLGKIFPKIKMEIILK